MHNHPQEVLKSELQVYRLAVDLPLLGWWTQETQDDVLVYRGTVTILYPCMRCVRKCTHSPMEIKKI